jgi:hypothetical protein
VNIACSLYGRCVAYSFVRKGLVMHLLSAQRGVWEDNNLGLLKWILGNRLD